MNLVNFQVLVQRALVLGISQRAATPVYLDYVTVVWPQDTLTQVKLL